MIKPNREDIEKQVLSHIITYEDTEVMNNLNNYHFYNDIYRSIFREYKNTANIEKVINNLKHDIPNIEEILDNIVMTKKSVSTINHQTDILKEFYIYRKMISFGEELHQMGLNKEKIHETDIKRFIEQITIDGKGEDFISLYELGKEYIKNYNEKPNFIKSGIKDLDDVFISESGDLICIAARPSMGKTAFQLQYGLGCAFNNKKVSAFSLEMKNEQLIQRILANISKITLDKIRNKNLTENEKEHLEKKLEYHLKKINFKVTSKSYNFNSLVNILRKEKKENGLDVVMIDYLQLIQTEGKNRNQEIGAITRGLKSLAKELDVVIILLSQLSRSVEQRADKRPILSDLRDSGEIEQDVDSCLLLYRDEYYNSDTENKNMLEIIIRKQRQGKLGTVDLFYDLNTQIISGLTRV